MSSIEVTVAAILERESRFLLVEERIENRLVLNQPAGHLEFGESLPAAVERETREETGLWFQPDYVTGIYLWAPPNAARGFLRIAFAGRLHGSTAPRPIDPAIVAAHWLGYEEIVGRAARLRSPMVLRSIDDYRRGVRYPLECLSNLLEGPVPP